MKSHYRYWKHCLKLVIVGILSALIACSCFAMLACGKPTDYTVGVLVWSQHGSLTQAADGFKSELTNLLRAEGKTVKFVVKNALADPSGNATSANALANMKPDVLLGVATPSAKALASSTTKIPILYTAVTDNVTAGLVGDNLTGMLDAAPMEKQIELTKKLAGDKKIGLLYTTSEENSVTQLEQAKAVANDKGYQFVVQGITQPSDLQTSFTTLATNPEVGAIWTPTDNTIADAVAAIHTINTSNKDAYKPIVCAAEDMTATCGVATYGIVYDTLGRRTAQMAFDILINGKTPADIEVGDMKDSAQYYSYPANADAIDFDKNLLLESN